MQLRDWADGHHDHRPPLKIEKRRRGQAIRDGATGWEIDRWLRQLIDWVDGYHERPIWLQTVIECHGL